MEVRRKNNYLELIFNEEIFLIDPPDLNQDLPVILTDINKNINKNKIFNSAGEYNVGNVYIEGFQINKTIGYIFTNNEGNLLYLREDLPEENLRKIKATKKEINALMVMDFFKESLVSYFKPKVILTNKNINLQNYQKQKGEKFKINLKKVENLLCIIS
jgi:hypothetical protein